MLSLVLGQVLPKLGIIFGIYAALRLREELPKISTALKLGKFNQVHSSVMYLHTVQIVA